MYLPVYIAANCYVRFVFLVYNKVCCFHRSLFYVRNNKSLCHPEQRNTPVAIVLFKLNNTNISSGYTYLILKYAYYIQIHTKN